LDRATHLERDLQHAERSALGGAHGGWPVHEIRNPLAAIRLKAENALAGGMERRTAPPRPILRQIDRLEGLLARLLLLARSIKPDIQKIDIPECCCSFAIPQQM